MTHCLTI